MSKVFPGVPPGAKAAVRARRRERPFARRLSVEQLDAIARRIAAPGHVGHPALPQLPLAGARHRDAAGPELIRQGLQRLRPGRLEPIERRAVALAALHQHALATLVHAQRERIRAVLDHLHRQHVGAERAPRVELACLDADVSQRQHRHGHAPPSSLSDSRVRTGC